MRIEDPTYKHISFGNRFPIQNALFEINCIITRGNISNIKYR